MEDGSLSLRQITPGIKVDFRYFQVTMYALYLLNLIAAVQDLTLHLLDVLYQHLHQRLLLEVMVAWGSGIKKSKVHAEGG